MCRDDNIKEIRICKRCEGKEIISGVPCDDCSPASQVFTNKLMASYIREVFIYQTGESYRHEDSDEVLLKYYCGCFKIIGMAHDGRTYMIESYDESITVYIVIDKFCPSEAITLEATGL